MISRKDRKEKRNPAYAGRKDMVFHYLLFFANPAQAGLQSLRETLKI